MAEEWWALAMRNLEQMAIFQLETFRTGQKEASAYDAELRTANEIPVRKLLEQIKWPKRAPRQSLEQLQFF